MSAAPREPRRGWLKNGNPVGDFMTAPRCGARTRAGGCCRCPAVKGRRRCRLHGGLSTGARTAAGLARCRQAATKHGFYSQAQKAERRATRMLIRHGRALLERMLGRP